MVHINHPASHTRLDLPDPVLSYDKLNFWLAANGDPQSSLGDGAKTEVLFLDLESMSFTGREINNPEGDAIGNWNLTCAEIRLGEGDGYNHLVSYEHR